MIKPKIQCYFLILPNFLPLDLAGPLQVMLTANNELDLYQIHYISLTPNVAMKGGLTVQPLDGLPELLPSNSRLIIPGLSNTNQFMLSADGEKISQWIFKQHIVANLSIATICSGALLLASSGLLFNRDCTTHYDLLNRLKAIEPSAKIAQNRLFVRDSSIWTSAGISSGIDMLLAMLHEDSDAHFTAKVAREMVVYMRRSASDPQLSPWLEGRNHMQQKIHMAQDIISSHLQESYSIEALAQKVNMSPRNLTRVFKNTTGQSIQNYTHALKIAKASKLLSTTKSSVDAIALECGFKSIRSFRRIWSKYHGITPGYYRNNVRETD